MTFFRISDFKNTSMYRKYEVSDLIVVILAQKKFVIKFDTFFYLSTATPLSPY